MKSIILKMNRATISRIQGEDRISLKINCQLQVIINPSPRSFKAESDSDHKISGTQPFSVSSPVHFLVSEVTDESALPDS